MSHLPDFLVKINASLIVAGRGDGRDGQDNECHDDMKDNLEERM